MFTARQKHKSSLYKRLSGGFLLLLVSLSCLPLARVCDHKFICPFSVTVYLFRFSVKQTDAPSTRAPGFITRTTHEKDGEQRVPGLQVLLHPHLIPRRCNAPTKTIVPTGRRSCAAKMVFLQRITRKNRRIKRKSKSQIYRTNCSSSRLQSIRDNVLKTAGTFCVNPAVETQRSFKQNESKILRNPIFCLDYNNNLPRVECTSPTSHSTSGAHLRICIEFDLTTRPGK